GFAKSRRVGREVAERDALDPALLLARVVRVGGRAEARVKAMSEIVETELPGGDRDPEGGDADRLRRRLQIVALREISPVEDDASVARDDPGAVSRERVVAGLLEKRGVQADLLGARIRPLGVGPYRLHARKNAARKRRKKT